MKNRSCKARGVFSMGAVLVLMLFAAAPAIADTDFAVLFDLDNNSGTGCTVATAAGTFVGADQRRRR